MPKYDALAVEFIVVDGHSMPVDDDTCVEVIRRMLAQGKFYEEIGWRTKRSYRQVKRLANANGMTVPNPGFSYTKYIRNVDRRKV